MSYVFPYNLEDIVNILAYGPNHDTDAMSAIKVALPSPGTSRGLRILRTLADEEFPDGCPDFLHREKLTFVEAIQEIASEVKNDIDPGYKAVMTRFLQDLGLVNSEPVPVSIEPAPTSIEPQETDLSQALDQIQNHPLNRPSQNPDTGAEKNLAEIADPIVPEQQEQQEQPVKQVQPTQPAKPIQQAQPTQPTQSAESVKQVQPTQPVQPAQPGQPANTAQQAKPAQPVNTAQSTQPVNTAQPVKPVEKPRVANPDQKSHTVNPDQNPRSANPEKQENHPQDTRSESKQANRPQDIHSGSKQANHPQDTRSESKQANRPQDIHSGSKQANHPQDTRSESKQANRPQDIHSGSKQANHPQDTRSESKQANRPQDIHSGSKQANHPQDTRSESKQTNRPQDTRSESKQANRPQDIHSGSKQANHPQDTHSGPGQDIHSKSNQGIHSGPDQNRIARQHKEPWTPLDDYAGPVLIRTKPSTDPDPHLSPEDFKNIVRLLPPPPAGEDGAGAGRWLEGEIWHPLCFNIRINSGKEEYARELFDMLQRFHSLPEAAFREYKTRAPMDAKAGQNTALDLDLQARDLGHFTHTEDAAVNALFESVMAYYNLYDTKVHADLLARIEFDLVVDPRLAVVVTSALDLETFFIQTGPESAEKGSAHDIRGTISMNCRLDLPTMLDRAVFLHFSTSTPLADSMMQSLTELRHAQCCRDQDREIEIGTFDAIFGQDRLTMLNAFDRKAEQPAGP